MKEKNDKENEINRTRKDKETKGYIFYMCRTCKFYKNRCTKNRVVRTCAIKGLKNKE